VSSNEGRGFNPNRCEAEVALRTMSLDLALAARLADFREPALSLTKAPQRWGFRR